MNTVNIIKLLTSANEIKTVDAIDHLHLFFREATYDSSQKGILSYLFIITYECRSHVVCHMHWTLSHNLGDVAFSHPKILAKVVKLFLYSLRHEDQSVRDSAVKNMVYLYNKIEDKERFPVSRITELFKDPEDDDGSDTSITKISQILLAKIIIQMGIGDPWKTISTVLPYIIDSSVRVRCEVARLVGDAIQAFSHGNSGDLLVALKIIFSDPEVRVVQLLPRIVVSALRRLDENTFPASMRAEAERMMLSLAKNPDWRLRYSVAKSFTDLFLCQDVVGPSASTDKDIRECFAGLLDDRCMAVQRAALSNFTYLGVDTKKPSLVVNKVTIDFLEKNVRSPASETLFREVVGVLAAVARYGSHNSFTFQHLGRLLIENIIKTEDYETHIIFLRTLRNMAHSNCIDDYQDYLRYLREIWARNVGALRWRVRKYILKVLIEMAEHVPRGTIMAMFPDCTNPRYDKEKVWKNKENLTKLRKKLDIF